VKPESGIVLVTGSNGSIGDAVMRRLPGASTIEMSGLTFAPDVITLQAECP